jgi:DNA helicase HerA-like ATPase
MEFFDQPGTSLILAKSKSGKTTLISNIVTYLTEKKSIAGVLLFSTTGKFNGDYPYIDKNLISTELDMRIISWIIADREKKILQGQAVSNLLIILDDVVGEQQLRSRQFEALISKARHFKLYIILSVQHPKVIGPLIRDNANVFALTKIDSKEGIKIIYDLSGYGGSIQEFTDFIEKNVDMYEWFVTNRCPKSKKTEDKHRIIQSTTKIPKFKWV